MLDIVLIGRALSLGLMSAAGFVVAQDGSVPDFGGLINAGALGLVVLAFFTDRIVTKAQMERVLADRDRAEAARDTVVQEQFQRVLPLLEGLNQRLIPVMEEVAARLDQQTK